MLGILDQLLDEKCLVFLQVRLVDLLVIVVLVCSYVGQSLRFVAVEFTDVCGVLMQLGLLSIVITPLSVTFGVNLCELFVKSSILVTMEDSPQAARKAPLCISEIRASVMRFGRRRILKKWFAKFFNIFSDYRLSLCNRFAASYVTYSVFRCNACSGMGKTFLVDGMNGPWLDGWTAQCLSIR